MLGILRADPEHRLNSLQSVLDLAPASVPYPISEGGRPPPCACDDEIAGSLLWVGLIGIALFLVRRASTRRADAFIIPGTARDILRSVAGPPFGSAALLELRDTLPPLALPILGLAPQGTPKCRVRVLDDTPSPSTVVIFGQILRDRLSRFVREE